MTSITKPTKRSSSASKAEFDLPSKSQREKARARRILDGFYKHYSDAECELDFTNAHELLVATILSAQATDVSVNKATPALFRQFSTPRHYAEATPAMIESQIRAIGLYRNKAKSIHETMKRIVEVYGGNVPDTMEDLLTLRGVARKTANVVLGNAYGVNVGVVVDTHVLRISQRFGLTKNTDAKKIELDLMALFPRPHWTQLSHMMIWHGRRVCKARGALCAEHPLCRSYCSNT